MIMPLALNQVAAEIGAHFINVETTSGANADCYFTQVSTDTRSIHRGDLFVALCGDNFDGHHFIGAAIEQGASAVVVKSQQSHLKAPQLLVSDTTEALGQIAVLNRTAFSGPLIAITGSSGKTSVKGMVASILANRGCVHATQGNLNNHIGVPLTLLGLGAEHDFAVVEMGASSEGEIGYLANLAKPDVALVNNVMPAHLEGFGSIEGVAQAKAEIFSSLSHSGTAIVNLDDDFSAGYLQLLHKRKCLTFSFCGTDSCHNDADFWISEYGSDKTGAVWFELQSPVGAATIKMQVIGQHNIANALAAATCSYAVGASLADIRCGLEAFQNIAGRMQVIAGQAGSLIIDDSYNANPNSVRAAIDTLIARPGETVLVLGDLGELGTEAAELHRQLGSYARKQGVGRMLTVGQLSQQASVAFGHEAEHFSTHDAAITRLRSLLHGNMVLLVKGSFSSRMGRVVRALMIGGEQ